MNKGLRRTLILASLLAAIILGVALVQYFFCSYATDDERRIGYYKNEPENSIDVLFLGASEMYSGWASGLAYEEYGFTSYPYCISAAPVTLWKDMLEDALKTQSPELVVIDPYGATLAEDDTTWGLYNPAPIYQLFGATPFSKEKVEAVEEICADKSTSEKLAYLFPFVKHHDNISDYVKNFKAGSEIREGKTSAVKGMRTMTTCYTAVPEMLTNTAGQFRQITPTGEKLLNEFLDYCKEKNVNVIFVHFPATIYEGSGIEDTNWKCNYVGKIVNSRGYDYINLQDSVIQMGLEVQQDFYSQNHLNVKGQRKATEYLGKILQERLGTDNINSKAKSRSEAVTADWENASATYEKFYNYACSNTEQGIIEYIGDGPTTIKKISNY